MANTPPSAGASASPSMYRAIVWRNASPSAGYADPACEAARTGCSVNCRSRSERIRSKVSSSRKPAWLRVSVRCPAIPLTSRLPVARTSAAHRSASAWLPSKHARHSTSSGGTISMASLKRYGSRMNSPG